MKYRVSVREVYEAIYYNNYIIEASSEEDAEALVLNDNGYLESRDLDDETKILEDEVINIEEIEEE